MKDHLEPGEKWRPEWRNEAAYDFVNWTCWKNIAWQFLRRNDNYFEDWDVYLSVTKKSDNQLYFMRRRQALGERWGLSELVDPTVNSPPYRWKLSRFARLITKSRKKENYIYLDLNIRYKRAYGFDLRKAITPQIDALKADLRELQAELIKEQAIKVTKPAKNIGDLKLYLRILDAVKSGASRDQIALQLEPYKSIGVAGTELEKLAEHLKAARRIVKKTYRDFLFRAQSNK